jgi:hypothetical protein
MSLVRRVSVGSAVMMPGDMPGDAPNAAKQGNEGLILTPRGLILTPRGPILDDPSTVLSYAPGRPIDRTFICTWTTVLLCTHALTGPPPPPLPTRAQRAQRAQPAQPVPPYAHEEPPRERRRDLSVTPLHVIVVLEVRDAAAWDEDSDKGHDGSKRRSGHPTPHRRSPGDPRDEGPQKVLQVVPVKPPQSRPNAAQLVVLEVEFGEPFLRSTSIGGKNRRRGRRRGMRRRVQGPERRVDRHAAEEHLGGAARDGRRQQR